MHRKILATLAASVASLALLAPQASAVQFPTIFPSKNTAGPGLKNWHCTDTAKSPDWWGPWRYTQSGAQADCYDYIAAGRK